MHYLTMRIENYMVDERDGHFSFKKNIKQKMLPWSVGKTSKIQGFEPLIDSLLKFIISIF